MSYAGPKSFANSLILKSVQSLLLNCKKLLVSTAIFGQNLPKAVCRSCAKKHITHGEGLTATQQSHVPADRPAVQRGPSKGWGLGPGKWEQTTSIYLPYFLDYKTHVPPQIGEENGCASYSPNVAYLAHWAVGGGKW